MTKLTTACLLLLALTGAAHADDIKPINIPAGDLTVALETLAKQSGIELIYYSEQLKGRSTKGVKGTLSGKEAAERLIEGTDLVLRTDSTGAMLITPKGLAPAKATAGANGGISVQLAQTGTQSSAASSTLTANEDARSATASDSDGNRIEEVIVTAQKRAERMQDIPVPVTAITGASLVEANHIRLVDYFSKVPGLNYTTGPFGEPVIAIRGLTSGSVANPNVAIMIDDVAYGSSTSAGGGGSAPDIDPGDLARVEILRGPQGTLYGANSISGLLKFVTADPSTDSLNGRVQAGVSSVQDGDKVGYNVRGSVNVPLGSTWAVLASGFTRRDPGYIDNIQTGEKDVNRGEVNGGRLSTLWRPTENVSLKLSALQQDFETNGVANVEPALGELKQSMLADTGIYHRKTEFYTGTLAVRLGRLDLVALTGYNVNSFYQRLDATPLYGARALASFGVDATWSDNDYKTTKFSQEVRVGSSVGRLEWLVAGYYTEEKVKWHQFLPAINRATGAVAGSLYDLTKPSEFEEYAAFANLTYHVTDRFDVQLGGRQSEIRQTGLPSLTSGALVNNVTIIGAQTRYRANAFTYQFTPRFKPSPETMLYARVASGYRPGFGDSDPPPNAQCVLIGVACSVEPDKTQNYELGFKGDFFGRTLSVDTSVYYVRWTDIQSPLQSPGGFNYTDNAGLAKSQGVELSVEARPLTGLSMAAWVAYSDAQLTEVPPSSTLGGHAGDRLPFGSRWSGHLMVSQDIPLTASITGFVGGSVSYVGDRMGPFVRTPVRQNLPAYANTQVQVGARYDAWTVNLFVDNVTDRRGITGGGIGSFTPTTFSLIQPRTIGMSLSRTF